MKINKVHLENYRVHKNLDIEFSSGINLLLGENGRGKSSILEAIGLALFSLKSRTKLEECISFGEKKAKIEIDFTGTNGKNYKITKTLPNGTQKLISLEDEILIEDTSILNSLCGIDGEIKDIYENIIVARQNEFISIFKDKPANREKIFNKIFNTDVYNTIYSGHLKETYDRYQKNLDILEARKDDILIKDEDKIKENLKEKELELLDKKLLREKLSSNLDIINKKLDEEKNLSQKLKNIDLQIENTLKNIEREEKTHKNLEMNLEEINLACKITEENYKNYENFLKIFDLKNEKKIKLDEIEKLYIKYEEAQKYITSKKERIAQENANKKIYENNIFINNEKINEKNLKLLNLEKKIKDNIKLRQEYILNIDSLQNLINELNELINSSNKINEEIIFDEKMLAQFNEEKKILIEKKEILEKKEIDKKIIKMKEMLAEINYLKSENDVINSKIIENKEAHETLKSSICPYLKENCENLKGKDINKFFQEKYDKFNSLIEKNLNKIDDLSLLIEKYKIYEEEEIILKNLYNNIDKINISISEKKENINLKKMKAQNINLKLENFKLKNNDNDINYFNEKLIKFNLLLEKLEIEEDTFELEKIKSEINEIKFNNLEIEKNLNLTLNKIELFQDRKEICEKYIEENNKIPKIYNELKISLEDIYNELKILEEPKNLYISNLKKSKELEKTKLEIENTIISINDLKNYLDELNQEKRKNQIKIKEFDKNLLLNEKSNLNNELEFIFSKLGELENEILNVKNEIKTNKNSIEKKKEMNKKINKLIKKIEITKFFRDKLNSMGKEISKNMLLEINDIATINFRKITGRGENIIWSNDGENKYEVYLVKGDTKLKFSQLSGGEQVAVSISIRGAMSEIFTESKFSIFDEPTNNLDLKRKESLASSIGEILKNLEQSIIVTHDETFREMAQKVIIL